MGLGINPDDAMLKSVGDVDRAIGGNCDVVDAVEDRRGKILGLSGSRRLCALRNTIPAHARDGLDLAVEDCEDLVARRELNAVELSLRIKVYAEGLTQLVGSGGGQDFNRRQRQGGEAE